MDNFTLFAANAVVVFVMASAFYVAGRARSEPFWSSWCVANIVIGFALLAFMFERRLPDLFIVTVPNCLLVLGISLRWRAAREFAGRKMSTAMVWAPSGLFIALCAWPCVFGSYAVVYTIVNVMLTLLALAAGYEFWRDREDRLPSRHGLVAAYGVLAVSFAARVGQGLMSGGEMARHLPDDILLMIHLSIGLLHIAASGAFALSLAYERDAVRLRRLATHDALTGLLNRGGFEAGVRDYLARMESTRFAIVIFDLDHFKQVNDGFGHAVGDDALKACASIFTEVLGEKHLVARWGGEEFAALLIDVSPKEAFEITERVRERIRSTTIRSRGHEIRPTVSAGICHGEGRPGDFDLLLSMADARLYSPKSRGRDRVESMAA